MTGNMRQKNRGTGQIVHVAGQDGTGRDAFLVVPRSSGSCSHPSSSFRSILHNSKKQQLYCPEIFFKYLVDRSSVLLFLEDYTSVESKLKVLVQQQEDRIILDYYCPAVHIEFFLVESICCLIQDFGRKLNSLVGRIADRLSEDVGSRSSFEQSFMLFEACHCGYSTEYFACTSAWIGEMKDYSEYLSSKYLSDSPPLIRRCRACIFMRIYSSSNR